MTSDKEVNVRLLEKLEIVETALELAEKENAVQTVAYLKNKKKWLEWMLYQEPPKID